MAPSTELNSELNEPIVTKAQLIDAFRELGISKGMMVYVQSSMNYFAKIIGGNRTIIEALKEVVTYEGGIVVASDTLDYIDPESQREKIPLYQIEMIKESMAGFSRKESLPDNALALQLMNTDGAYRSNHPYRSVVAWGKYAKMICDKHPLHFPMGKDSPIEKLRAYRGYMLMLGTRYEDCDIFQAARINDASTPIKIVNAAIIKQSRNGFLSVLDYDYQKRDIKVIREMMEERQIVSETALASAKCRLFSINEAMTLAAAYYHTYQEDK